MNFQSKGSGTPWPPLAVAISLMFVYVYFFGGPTMLVWRAKQDAARDPRLALVPTLLSDTSVSASPGTRVTFFGYQFEVPWQGQATVKNAGDYIAVAFNASATKSLEFVNPANSLGLVKTTRAGLKERGLDPRNADLVLNAGSDYDLMRSILYAAPAQLSLVFPRKKDVWAATFLMMKEVEVRGAEAGLYSFQIGQLRGFQIGDPSRARNVRVESFDADDRKFEFVFGCKPGSDASFKQTEINRVLQTLQRAPGSQQ